MRVEVNGQPRELAVGATVSDVLDTVSAPPTGVAVALDGAVLPRSQWAATELREGARLEVLTAVQGG